MCVWGGGGRWGHLVVDVCVYVIEGWDGMGRVVVRDCC